MSIPQSPYAVHVARLLREKLKREYRPDHAASTSSSSGGAGGRVVIALRPEVNPGDTFRSPNACWLCGIRAALPFSPSMKSVPRSVPLPDSLATPAALLCPACFSLAFECEIVPLLAVDQRSHTLAELLNKVATQSLDDKALGDIDRVAAARRAARWSCARCTYLNNPTVDYCEVCTFQGPRVSKCTLCGVAMKLQDTKDICKVAHKRHDLWECGTCTMIQTVAGDYCNSCHAPRAWKCDRCSRENYVARSVTGERCCRWCGHAQLELTASLCIRMGMDPTEMEREKALQAERDMGLKRLQARFSTLGIAKVPQLGDGNCQFRSLANQLLNDSRLHMLVRSVVVDFIATEGRADFLPFFDDDAAMVHYLRDMACSGTWGDEMTLKAAAQAFGVHVHVITSNDDNWHRHYKPKSRAVIPEAATEQQQRLSLGVHIFLSYQYPVHYDDVTTPVVVPDIMQCLSDKLKLAEAEEQEWVDAGPCAWMLGPSSTEVHSTESSLSKSGGATIPAVPAAASPAGSTASVPSMASRQSSSEGWEMVHSVPATAAAVSLSPPGSLKVAQGPPSSPVAPIQGRVVVRLA